MYNSLFHSINEKVELSEKDFNKFLELVKVKTIKKNDFFLNEGDLAKYIAFVNKGVLYSYSVDLKGEKHIVQIALENNWISDLYSFLSNEPAIFNVQAIEETEITIINKENFEKACNTFPAFEKFFRLLIQKAYVISQRRVSRIYSDTAEERYQKLIKDNDQIIFRVPQHYIASYLGIKPQSLSRIRKSLKLKDK